MPFASLKLNPGINVELTPLLNEASFSYSSAIRFRDGLPEKIGGWQALNNSSPLVGICTGLHAWADLASNPYIAAGTDQRLEIFYGGVLGDITPIRITTNNTPDFTTVINTKTVTVHDAGHGDFIGDWIDIVIPVSVGGIVLQGFYQIVTVPDADHYTITAASNATASTSGGAVPEFKTTATDPNVTVILDDHGYVADQLFAVQVETIVGGLTIGVGSYNITSVTNANRFVITPGGAAASDDDVFENSGNARIDYLIHSGLQSAAFSDTSGTYGSGPYGAGIYGGSGSQAVVLPLRQWFLDNFGQDLVGNYTGSPLYLWVPPPASGNPAVAIDTTNFPSATSPPQVVNVSFVSAPTQQIICLGADDPFTHIYDPNLVRWCNAGDFTDWVATSTNQAGSYRIPSGSRLVGGIRSPNFIAIWTDIDMWVMTYLGAGLVWGFTQIAKNNLLAARAAVVFRNIVFWAGSNGFYAFDGNTVQLIPCPVWDKFWYNLDTMQVDKINAECNSDFQEISWSFPSKNGGTGLVDSRVTYNIREQVWTYDDSPTPTSRTAWIDHNVYGPPVGTTIPGLLMQHDVQGVYDANGAALNASVQTGWFAMSEGTYLMMMERLMMDAIATGGSQQLQVTVYTQNYASGPVSTYGPYPYVPGTGPPYSIVRARGRNASIKIESVDRGVFWRLGNLRFLTQQAGRNP